MAWPGGGHRAGVGGRRDNEGGRGGLEETTKGGVGQSGSAKEEGAGDGCHGGVSYAVSRCQSLRVCHPGAA